MKTLREIAELIADGAASDTALRRLRSLVAADGIRPTIEGHAPTGSKFDEAETARARLGVRLLECGIPTLEAAYALMATRGENWGEVVADPWQWVLDIIHVRNSTGIVEVVADLRPLGAREGFELPAILTGLHEDPVVLGVLSINLADVFFDAR